MVEARPLYETHFGGADGENLPEDDYFYEEEVEKKGISKYYNTILTLY